MSNKKKSGNIFLRMHPIHRILISIGLSLITFLIIKFYQVSPQLQFMILWDVFSFSYIFTSWIVFFTRTPLQIRHYAKKEDGSRVFVFVLVLLSALASMFNVLQLVLSKDTLGVPARIYLPVALIGMLFSWVLVHTIFTFHYAHLYYGDDEEDPETHAEGLIFPGEKEPDYIDFAYFSFVLGMTFQVSDIQITSRPIRRLALLHGLISFALFTFVVALAVNFIGNLKG